MTPAGPGPDGTGGPRRPDAGPLLASWAAERGPDWRAGLEWRPTWRSGLAWRSHLLAPMDWELGLDWEALRTGWVGLSHHAPINSLNMLVWLLLPDEPEPVVEPERHYDPDWAIRGRAVGVPHQLKDLPDRRRPTPPPRRPPIPTQRGSGAPKPPPLRAPTQTLLVDDRSEAGEAAAAPTPATRSPAPRQTPGDKAKPERGDPRVTRGTPTTTPTPAREGTRSEPQGRGTRPQRTRDAEPTTPPARGTRPPTRRQTQAAPEAPTRPPTARPQPPAVGERRPDAAPAERGRGWSERRAPVRDAPARPTPAVGVRRDAPGAPRGDRPGAAGAPPVVRLDRVRPPSAPLPVPNWDRIEAAIAARPDPTRLPQAPRRSSLQRPSSLRDSVAWASVRDGSVPRPAPARAPGDAPPGTGATPLRAASRGERPPDRRDAGPGRKARPTAPTEGDAAVPATTPAASGSPAAPASSLPATPFPGPPAARGLRPPRLDAQSPLTRDRGPAPALPGAPTVPGTAPFRSPRGTGAPVPAGSWSPMRQVYLEAPPMAPPELAAPEDPLAAWQRRREEEGDRPWPTRASTPRPSPDRGQTIRTEAPAPTPGQTRTSSQAPRQETAEAAASARDRASTPTAPSRPAGVPRTGPRAETQATPPRAGATPAPTPPPRGLTGASPLSRTGWRTSDPVAAGPDWTFTRPDAPALGARPDATRRRGATRSPTLTWLVDDEVAELRQPTGGEVPARQGADPARRGANPSASGAPVSTGAGAETVPTSRPSAKPTASADSTAARDPGSRPPAGTPSQRAPERRVQDRRPRQVAGRGPGQVVEAPTPPVTWGRGNRGGTPQRAPIGGTDVGFGLDAVIKAMGPREAEPTAPETAGIPQRAPLTPTRGPAERRQRERTQQAKAAREKRSDEQRAARGEAARQRTALVSKKVEQRQVQAARQRLAARRKEAQQRREAQQRSEEGRTPVERHGLSQKLAEKAAERAARGPSDAGRSPPIVPNRPGMKAWTPQGFRPDAATGAAQKMATGVLSPPGTPPTRATVPRPSSAPLVPDRPGQKVWTPAGFRPDESTATRDKLASGTQVPADTTTRASETAAEQSQLAAAVPTRPGQKAWTPAGFRPDESTATRDKLASGAQVPASTPRPSDAASEQRQLAASVPTRPGQKVWTPAGFQPDATTGSGQKLATGVLSEARGGPGEGLAGAAPALRGGVQPSGPPAPAADPTGRPPPSPGGARQPAADRPPNTASQARGGSSSASGAPRTWGQPDIRPGAPAPQTQPTELRQLSELVPDRPGQKVWTPKGFRPDAETRGAAKFATGSLLGSTAPGPAAPDPRGSGPAPSSPRASGAGNDRRAQGTDPRAAAGPNPAPNQPDPIENPRPWGSRGPSPRGANPSSGSDRRTGPSRTSTSGTGKGSPRPGTSASARAASGMPQSWTAPGQGTEGFGATPGAATDAAREGAQRYAAQVAELERSQVERHAAEPTRRDPTEPTAVTQLAEYELLVILRELTLNEPEAVDLLAELRRHVEELRYLSRIREL